MYYFTPDTITQANKQISSLDAKVGGVLCILHCLGEKIDENVNYTVSGTQLRKQLSLVFDKEPRVYFENVKPSYIIFAREWADTFFKRYIKNKVDLLACAVFFLRRKGFEREFTEEQLIDSFVKEFNLQQLKDQWFFKGNKVTLAYNQASVEDNQIEFYSQMNYTNDFKSILFSGVIQKSAADLKAAGQIQTLYSGSGVQTCFLLSDEPLDQYYIMSASNNNEKDASNNTSDLKIANNILFYGVPGAGKSYEIDKMIVPERSERVVFHPDYTYSDFVGQILPRIIKEKGETEGKLRYVFEPGPFTKMLKKANEFPHDMYFLVIEEINRGNAPAIFGDVFQLLDRNDDGSGKYHISNYDMAKVVYGEGKEDELIRMPANLTILATMNTSDQNVFTLDTAFQRRWEMHLIKNDVYKAEHAGKKIEGSEISWGRFADITNREIIRFGEETGSSEDKRLGAYFARFNELTKTKFPEKVLKYLWDDAFKMDHYTYFNENISSVDGIIEVFRESQTEVDILRRVLKLTVYQKMLGQAAARENTEDAAGNSETEEGKDDE